MKIEVKDNTLIIPEGTMFIDQDYFENFDGSKITKIVLPDTLELIDNDTFSAKFKNLKEINFPPSLEVINAFAFSECESLEHVKLNEGLKFMGDGVFDHCNLKSLHIPSTVTEMYSCAGYNLNLKKITVSKDNRNYSDMNCNIIYDKEYKTVIQGCSTSIIPKEAETLGEGCFYGANIKQIIIPKNIKSIEQIAFDGIKATDIIIKCSISELESNLFIGCPNLENIYITDDIDKDSEFYKDYGDMIKRLTIDDLLEKGKSFKEVNKLLKLKDIER